MWPCVKSLALCSAMPGPDSGARHAPAEAVNGDSPDATMCLAISSLVHRFGPPLQSVSTAPPHVPSPDPDVDVGGEDAAFFVSDELELERRMAVGGEDGVMGFPVPFACDTGLRDGGGAPFSINTSNVPALFCRPALPVRKFPAKSPSKPLFACINDGPNVDGECAGAIAVDPHDDELEGDEVEGNPGNPNVSNEPRFVPLMPTGLVVVTAADVVDGVSGVSANDMSQGLLAIVRHRFGGGRAYWPNCEVE